MRQGFLIPVYNHGKTAGPLVEKLSLQGLPIIVVDDGSDGETRAALAAASAFFPLTVTVRLPGNCGKGAAIAAGIDKAHELGLTHVLQIDADGQHDLDRVVFFLEQSTLHPEALICGYPEFDASVPRIRAGGKGIANFWTRIVTLSGDALDGMCGFRVYPVEAARRFFHHHRFDKRMGIDIEIMVRLSWKNIPLLFHPVKVVYPEGGISHFRYVQDSVRITWLFIRLFFGMIIRLPFLAYRARQRTGRGG
jgi:glycosyltransferase involved in cell wall biosynthesis